MKKVFIVHGMQRSGNHAIINWIKAQGWFLFFNNILPIRPILLGKKEIPPVQDFDAWVRTHVYASRFPALATLKRIAYACHRLIVSFEDHDVALKPFRDIPQPYSNILIVRSPSNFFASRIRRATAIGSVNPVYPTAPGREMGRIIDFWKRHAREYLGITDHLTGKVGIYYDRWFTDKLFRRQISRTLGLRFSDRGLNIVTRHGEGSSFDQTRYHKNSQKMNVLDRAGQLSPSEKEVLDGILRDTELVDLGLQLQVQTDGMHRFCEI